MKVLIVFYSRYGNTAKLAEAIAEGARSVSGTEVSLRRVADLAPEDVIARDEKWIATREALAKYPPPTMEDLDKADAIVWGTPTRFGNMTAELKLFLDTTGGLWVKGKLVNKVTSVFTCNSTAHSGKESTLLSMMIPLLHHGMMIIGVPQTVPETASAGSYYGATATSGPGNTIGVTEADQAVARAQGKRMAEVSAALVKGGLARGV
ncbi:MAG: NAD(P)H:quinone oxidoreductase [Dehalococcoidia bacterium]|nr:NAD(P)H:quinone oxidoreductase [Dehalococcoidia bacterium]